MNNHLIIYKLEARGFQVRKIVDGLGRKKWQVNTRFYSLTDSNLRSLFKKLSK